MNVITPEGIDGATGWLSIDPAAVDDSSSLLRFHFLPFFGSLWHHRISLVYIIKCTTLVSMCLFLYYTSLRGIQIKLKTLAMHHGLGIHFA